MKRLLTLLLVLCLLIPELTFAQSDIKGMTDEQLIQVYGDIVSEMFARGKSATIPVGKYVVGAHIPAGEYTVATGASIMGSWLEVDNAEGAYGPDHQLYILQSGQSVGRLILKEGNILEVTMGDAILTKLLGVLFEFK